MPKQPYFPFYPDDWLADIGLRRCSFAAQGFWMRVLCLMHQCEDRGVLASSGVAWSDDEIARAVGGDRTDTLALLDDCLTLGVASRNKRGAVVCRRMVRDEAIRKERAKAGSKGGSKTAANRAAKTHQTPEDEDENETNSEKKEPGVRARDLVFEAVCEAFDKRSVNDATQDRLDDWTSGFLGLGATPEDIRASRAVYAELHPTQHFGPGAVIDHWSEVHAVIHAADRSRAKSAASAKRAGAEKKAAADKAAADRAFVLKMAPKDLVAVVDGLADRAGRFMSEPPPFDKVADNWLWAGWVVEEAKRLAEERQASK